MSEYMFGLTFDKPTSVNARKMDRICREEGGSGLNEVNVKKGWSPWINNGRYQGWFCGPNRGDLNNRQLAQRVMRRIESECV